MVSNTRHIVFGLMLGVGQLSRASPVEPSVAVDTPEYRSESVAVDVPEYRTASATVAVDVPEYRTASATVAVDVPEYRTASDSVAVDVPEYRTASASASISTDCPEKCSKAYDECRGKHDANRSTCAANYAQCLGFNPFGDDGSLITPTACSAASNTAVVSSATVAVDVPEYRTASASAPVSTDCPEKCSKAYDECRGKPDANRSTCAANYAQCLGFNPFGNDGSLIHPTACSAASDTAVASSAAKPTGTDTPPVIVSGAGRALPTGVLGAIGAFGMAMLMFF
ncbi:hypothetical protein NW762_014027 [Fusarium torreyae]|uniref:Uncharacterized protein n=1 Tax=Fusarium torreyae TaxID=1237075 RepID=A0A9W8V9T5_9HYPO|nr:hypothetical protein NW762_014027 [Fusarium torreyae]